MAVVCKKTKKWRRIKRKTNKLTLQIIAICMQKIVGILCMVAAVLALFKLQWIYIPAYALATFYLICPESDRRPYTLLIRFYIGTYIVLIMLKFLVLLFFG